MNGYKKKPNGYHFTWDYLVKSKMVGRSLLQKQVLNLYRDFLCVARRKPEFKTMIMQEFRKNAAIPRTDTLRIEFLLRKGKRKLELIQDPTVGTNG